MKKKLIVFTGLSVCLAFLVVACSKSSEDVLSGGTPTVVTCDTTNMSYATNIAPIVTANCLPCHGSGGIAGIVLTSWTGLSVYAKNGHLAGDIRHDAGFDPMPQGAAKISDCNINKIVAWIHQGAKNN